jgi:hypothetical protein
MAQASALAKLARQPATPAHVQPSVAGTCRAALHPNDVTNCAFARYCGQVWEKQRQKLTKHLLKQLVTGSRGACSGNGLDVVVCNVS